MLDVICAVHGKKIDEIEMPERNQSTVIITGMCPDCMSDTFKEATRLCQEGIDG